MTWPCDIVILTCDIFSCHLLHNELVVIPSLACNIACLNIYSYQLLYSKSVTFIDVVVRHCVTGHVTFLVSHFDLFSFYAGTDFNAVHCAVGLFIISLRTVLNWFLQLLYVIFHENLFFVLLLSTNFS